MLACWETIVKDIEKEMQNDALEKYLTPLSLHANNYEVKKSMAFSIVRTFFRSTLPPENIGKVKKTESEVWIETKDGKIGGKIDSVVHTGNGVEIFDYKTGAILNFG